MNWSKYHKNTFQTTPNYLAVYLVNHHSFETVIDLGCGSGNDSVYFARKGKKVLAMDGYLNEEYILSRLTKREIKRVQTQKVFFEEVLLPKVDCIYSVFSLPFCNPCHFAILWNYIVQTLEPGGLFAGNLFGERDSHAKDSKVNVFSEKEVKELLKDFVIIKWKEQEYDKESMHFHYYDFVAVKK